MNLVVMAAGMGSRFGGLKQLTPVGPNGEFLIDYSIYDAICVGVDKVIFVIRREHLEMFRDTIGRRIEDKIKLEYVFQELNDLPIDVGDIVREKPWGTGQAIYACRECVRDSFIVINADDFYGRDAMQVLANFLYSKHDDDVYAMVGYQLKNTLSENGTVSRGICEESNGYLKRVTEMTKLGYVGGKLVNDEGTHYTLVDEDSLVSVNLFGFTPRIFEDISLYFKEFLMNLDNLERNEFYLPVVLQKCIDDDKACVKVLRTSSKFNGMTYKQDLEGLQKNIQLLINEGVYPSNLWR